MIVPYIACGFVVGTLVGFTGMGGGSVMTAMLILLFGIHPVSAVGTDLLFAAATKSVGARVHSDRGNVAWRLVGLLALGSVPGASAMLLLLSRLPVNDSGAARLAKIAIGMALLVAGASLLLSRSMPFDDAGDAAVERVDVWRALATVALGALLGVLVSATSVGAGAIGLVVLRHLYPGVPAVRLVGSDIAHAVPLTLLAGAGHWLLGDVDWRLLLLLLGGSIPGIIVGSHFAHIVSDRVLRLLLGVVLVVIACSLMIAGAVGAGA